MRNIVKKTNALCFVNKFSKFSLHLLSKQKPSFNVWKRNIYSFRSFNFSNVDSAKALEEVESGVFEILKNSPKCKVEKLSREARLEDLGFDSLDIVELVVAFEEKFQVSLNGMIINKSIDEDALKVDSVLAAIQMFHKYLTQAPPS